MEQKLLINELLVLTMQAIEDVRKFQSYDEVKLNYKRNSNEWSILECIEHLNIYGTFYLPKIEAVLINSDKMSTSTIFKSGLIGNYFVSLMKIKKGKLKKLKTPKNFNPINTQLNSRTIDQQLEQLEKLELLIHLASSANLTKLKTDISLTNLIKLRLGDTLSFVVYHIVRHVAQANNLHKL